MVDFVLDDLGCPAGEGFQPYLKIRRFVAHLDFLVSFGFPGAAQQGQAPFLRLILPCRLHDLRVQHQLIGSLVVKGDDAHAVADHVRRHAHAGVLVGCQGVQQVLGNLQIRFCGSFAFPAQK